jgi:hypothetical protein
LEKAQAVPRSRIAVWYGTFAAFEAKVQADTVTGKLDQVEMPMVLAALRRWQADSRR